MSKPCKRETLMSVYLSHLRYILNERAVAAMQCQMDCAEVGEVVEEARFNGMCLTYSEVIKALDKSILKAKALERKQSCRK